MIRRKINFYKRGNRVWWSDRDELHEVIDNGDLQFATGQKRPKAYVSYVDRTRQLFFSPFAFRYLSLSTSLASPPVASLRWPSGEVTDAVSSWWKGGEEEGGKNERERGGCRSYRKSRNVRAAMARGKEWRRGERKKSNFKFILCLLLGLVSPISWPIKSILLCGWCVPWF